MTNFLQAIPWKRWWKIGKPFWVSDQRRSALLHLLGILALVAVNTGAGVLMNIYNGRFMDAVGHRSSSQFWHYLILWVGLLVLVAPVQVFSTYLRTRLAIIWRRWLATGLFTGYFTNLAYYKLLKNNAIDNPDQRMAQDVDSFCNQTVNLFGSIIDSVVNVVSFVGVLWAVSSSLTFGVFIYAAIGSVIVIFLGRRMPWINFQQMKTEADLRFTLSEVRREAETVAFYRGELVANKQAVSRLGAVIAVLMDLMNTNRNIGLFTGLYYALVPVIPAVVMGYFYVHGNIPLGAISQAGGAFSIVFWGAVVLIVQFQNLSTYAAVINRIGSFSEALEAASVDPLPPSERIDIVDGDAIAFDNVTVLTADLQKQIVRGLTVHIPPGDNLLIAGRDGAGKTTLMRVMAGLLNAGSGQLTRPAAANIMFLTQNPYLPAMTLREALCYPSTQKCMVDTRLKQVLDLVNLPDLLERCNGFDTEQQWRQMLTIGEMQRLGLARIILAKPSYVVIDEATSALEEDNETLLYALLASLGSTYISASDRASIAKYHNQVLELDGSGGWEIYPASEYKPKSLKLRRPEIPKDDER